MGEVYRARDTRLDRTVAIKILSAQVTADAHLQRFEREARAIAAQLSVKEKETVNVPVWAGVGAIVIGGALLLIGGKKS